MAPADRRPEDPADAASWPPPDTRHTRTVGGERQEVPSRVENQQPDGPVVAAQAAAAADTPVVLEWPSPTGWQTPRGSVPAVEDTPVPAWLVRPTGPPAVRDPEPHSRRLRQYVLSLQRRAPTVRGR